MIPISQSALPMVCPWCPLPSLQGAQPQAVGTGQVWLTGAGHLLITDSQGHRLGYAGTQFVNEIPGATDNPIDGGLGIALEPIYTLPLSQTYSILLDGQTLTQTQTASLVQFGPDYAIGADDILLDPTTQDHLVIAPDGSQVVYQPSTSKAVTLRLATDSPTQGYQFQFAGTDLTAGQPVTATVDTASGQLVYNNRKAGNGTYDLSLAVVVNKLPAGEVYRRSHRSGLQSDPCPPTELVALGRVSVASFNVAAWLFGLVDDLAAVRSDHDMVLRGQVNRDIVCRRWRSPARTGPGGAIRVWVSVCPSAGWCSSG